MLLRLALPALLAVVLLPASPAIAQQADDATPTVQDWRTGVWRVKAADYYVFIDLDGGHATGEGVRAPITATFEGDSMHIRLEPRGLEGLAQLDLHHADGILMGTLRTPRGSRIIGGRRPVVHLVRTVEADDCTLAQYTDDSWRIAPHKWHCQQALIDYLGARPRYPSAAYEPG